MNDEKEKVKEMKRRNGYYFYKDRQLPSVSTILKSAGNSEGLVHWACKQGGLGVIWGLSKIKDAQSLSERLGSPSCIEWAVENAKMGLEAEGNRVKDFGSRVHKGIECHLKREDLDISEWTEEEKTALESFQKFYAHVGFDPIAVETPIYSEECGYAGRLDLVAEVNKEQVEKLRTYLTKSSPDIIPGLLICDFKTGKMYPRTQGVQLAAYSTAYAETFNRKCNGGLIINIERDAPDKVRCHYFRDIDLIDSFFFGFKPAYDVWMYWDAPRWFQQQEEELEAIIQQRAAQGGEA